ncbi:unnamed protein product [Zymoseptoria tritici ST99CH_1E4]|uniref:DUF7580 domain-containing protein n=1 Tax=Zymoseptoria tritici ST99CH_1E4 TaxID=1276532 RepID=A0A2H1FYA2_ZYMTR|nr:unnamed protein product [Zymoseptoria tritici ST99CH_1E4]
MSGIEVAGLVLVIIPIITSALGALDRAPDKYARFESWRISIPILIAQLKAQQTRLVVSLGLLFQLAGLPQPNLMDINQHDRSTFWNRPDIVDSLKAVYGDVYDAIESDLIHIRILMADLCERLGLGHIIEASELGNSSRPQTRHPSLKSTLRSRWVYSQSGKEIQNLVLQLDSRQQSIRGTLDDVSSQTRRRNVVVLPRSLSWFLSMLQTWALSAPGSTSMLFSTVHTIENDSAPELHSNPLARPLVSDICAEVEPRPQKCSSPVLEIHFSLGSDPGSLQMSQRPTVQAVLKDSISLYQLLEQPAPQSGYFAPRRLGEKDRRFLATRIALYALQLQGTPWTSGKWTGHDILFVSGESPELPRPFISKSFERSAQATSMGTENQAQHVYSHRFFLALATLMMSFASEK